MSKGKANVDYSLCMACGVCVQSCPTSCLELTKIGQDHYKKAYPELTKDDKCNGCGICQAACPVECINIA